MILVVAGGRDYRLDWNDYVLLERAFNDLKPCELRHGGCRGVDSDVARFAAREFPGTKIVRYAADWKVHGRAAGPIRNAKMMVGADALLWFPGGSGTKNAIQCAESAGLQLFTPAYWESK